MTERKRSKDKNEEQKVEKKIRERRKGRGGVHAWAEAGPNGLK